MSRLTREQVEQAIIEADEYMADHRVTESWRVISRLHAVLTRLSDAPESSTGDAEAEAERDRLRGVLLADIEQIKREASDEPYREPDHLEALLGIDPNDTADRLAARAVEYRYQRNDAAHRAEKAELQVEAVRALADEWAKDGALSQRLVAADIRAALDAT